MLTLNTTRQQFIRAISSSLEKYKKGAQTKHEKILHRVGGRTRKTVMFSIKRRKGSSEPGMPPHSHTGRLRDNIFYEVVDGSSVLIGPASFGAAGTEILERLEFGGIRRGKKSVMRYEPRPYLGPSQKSNEGFYLDLMRDF